MPLIPSTLPTGAFPGNPQDLLNLFADHLTAPPQKRSFFAQSSSSNVPIDGSALWFDTTNGGLKVYVNNEWVSAALPDGAITGAQLAVGTITGDKIADGQLIKSNFDPTIFQTYLGEGAVTTINIADGSVTSKKIASGAINQSHLSPGCITGDKIKQGSIDATRIGAGAITGSHIADNSIGLSQLDSSTYGYFLQPGSIVWWAQGGGTLNAPTGWFKCDGSSHSTYTYPILSQICFNYRNILPFEDATTGAFTWPSTFNLPSDIPNYGGAVPIIRADFKPRT